MLKIRYIKTTGGISAMFLNDSRFDKLIARPGEAVKTLPDQLIDKQLNCYRYAAGKLEVKASEV